MLSRRFLIAAAVAAFATQAQAQTCRLDTIQQKESDGRNVPNYRYDPHHTAGGHWQITDTDWTIWAPRAGFDLAKYPNALSATQDIQGQVAGLMCAHRGYMPWVPYNYRLAQALGPDASITAFPGAAVPPPVQAQTASPSREAPSPMQPSILPHHVYRWVNGKPVDITKEVKE